MKKIVILIVCVLLLCSCSNNSMKSSGKIKCKDIETILKYDNNPRLIIGDNVSIMDNCQISCINSIIIGNGCLFGDNVFITDNFHGEGRYDELIKEPLKRDLVSKGGVKIDRNVWIGRNACVMPGVNLGEGCIVAANSVVTHSFQPYSIVGGVPARLIKQVNGDNENGIS